MSDVLESIGFYELEKLSDCELSGLAHRISFADWVPDELPSRAVIVGRFYHDLMESDFKSQANNEDYEFVRFLISKYRVEISSNPRLKSLGDPGTWKEINEAAKAYLQSNSGKSGRNATDSEVKKLYSKSRLLVGKPDFLRIAENKAELREFKSSEIYSEGDLVEKHLRQIKYYAYLVFENFEVTLVSASIVGLAGHEVPFQITKEDALAFGEECENKVKEAWKKIRSSTNPQELAVIGSWCKHCSLKPACTTFQQNQMLNEDFNGHRTIRGILQRVTGSENSPKAHFEGFSVTFPTATGVRNSILSALIGKPIITTNCRGSNHTFEASIRSQVIEVLNA